jgi:hypothetical protein
METGRRGFLGLFGGAIAAATVAPKVIEAAIEAAPVIAPIQLPSVLQSMPSTSDLGVVTSSVTCTFNSPMWFPIKNGKHSISTEQRS